MNLALNVSYECMWLTYFFKICITSYMNVKFSRELKKTNDEFCLVFNDTESTVCRAWQTNL